MINCMLKFFAKYLKFYKLETIFAPIFKLLEAVFALIVPLIIANIIDNGINGNLGQDYIVKQGLILLALAVIGFCSTMVCQILAVRTSTGYGYKVRTDLYHHINTFSAKEINKFGASSLQTRLSSDVVITQTGLALLLRLAVRAPFLVIGSIVMSFIVNPQMAVIFVVIGAVLGFVIYFVSKASIPYNKKIQRKLDDLTYTAKDNLSGARVIRAFNKEDYEKARFEKTSNELQKTATTLSRISSALNPLNTIIVNVGIIAILYFGGMSVDAGSLTQGEIVALINYMTQISLAIVVVSNLVVSFSRAASSASRIEDVFNTKSTVVNGDKKPRFIKNAIEFDNVSFKYSPNAEPVLSNINIKIQKGQTIGVIGGTGSGKSSLVDLIERYYDATEGTVKINNVDIKEYDLSYLRNNIGFVSQGATLFSGTIRSNLTYGNADATDRDIEDALEIAQAKEVVTSKTKGLDAHVTQGGKNFSGGQRQRLTIARSLTKKPKILILDDSSSALDFQTDFRLRQAIKNKTDSMTTVIISQRATSIKYADNIIVLDEGKIVGEGKHDDLYAKCTVYREICDSQRVKEAK